MTAYVSVKGFEKFQHYRDRSPPWIKLYNELLDDYEFGCLQDASKLHLILIWLLASRMNNRVPADPEWLGKRINATEDIDLNSLISAGFLIPDSNMLASCKQSACLEREREGEGEKEAEKKEERVAEQNSATMSFETKSGAWELSAAKAREWTDTYPNLDVPAELRKARQWLRDNPTRRKTPRGMTKCLGGWLSRAADKAVPSKPNGAIGAAPSHIWDDL